MENDKLFFELVATKEFSGAEIISMIFSNNFDLITSLRMLYILALAIFYIDLIKAYHSLGLFGQKGRPLTRYEPFL